VRAGASVGFPGSGVVATTSGATFHLLIEIRRRLRKIQELFSLDCDIAFAMPMRNAQFGRFLHALSAIGSVTERATLSFDKHSSR
jgi:hypothetical protein